MLKDIINKYHHICWYPSAGADFRPFLYLSEPYVRLKDLPIDPEALPDLFIFTDCNPEDIPYTKQTGMSEITKLNSEAFGAIKRLFYSFDGRTRITLEKPPVLADTLHLSSDVQAFTLDMSENYGKAFLMKARVYSESLGEWSADCLYVIAENAEFAFRYLIPNRITTEYVIRVRYGDNFGGSLVSGDWLIKLADQLIIKYFLSNRITEESLAYIPEILIREYPEYRNLLKNPVAPDLKQIHEVSGRSWSDQGDICWYQLS